MNNITEVVCSRYLNDEEQTGNERFHIKCVCGHLISLVIKICALLCVHLL